ncbi:MAG: ABC transporter substrate-binding protein [Niastella sp.]|nr:ABC transporter substrate-binding protein [Niastella sp.]
MILVVNPRPPLNGSKLNEIMINPMKFILLLFVLTFACTIGNAQVKDTAAKPFVLKSDPIIPVNHINTYHIAIFAPLYLDSAFNGNDYRYNKNFPRFTLPGFDFIQGAQLALDSLGIKNSNITASIYDSKSYNQPVEMLIENHALDSINLIIGSVKDIDYTQLANFAQQKNIPFLSATYPNDGGITANPFLVILNPTLKAHCEAIFSNILQNHGSKNIVLVRKPGSQEDKVATYFDNINTPDGKPLLKLKVLNIENEDFSMLKNALDSNKQNIIIGGSLSESFAAKLATVCSNINKAYPTLLFGMPNWENFSFVNNKPLKDYPVYFTSSYYNGKWDNTSKMILETYRNKYQGNPSDLVYKGYETVYQFINLITKYPDDYMSHLNDYGTKVFSDFNFRPVFLSQQSKVPDYFENKHLYFLKAMNGSTSRVW